MTSITPSDRHRGFDYGASHPLSPHEQATADALIQIDKQFGKRKPTAVQQAKIDKMVAEKAAKKAQGPVQKGKGWTNNIKKQHVNTNVWNQAVGATAMNTKPGELPPLDAVQAMLRLTAMGIDITAGAQGQNMRTTVVFEGDGLQRFAAMCKRSGAGASGPNSEYDLEILQEQVTEVGDELSDDFKKGIEAAVAVLLEGKHLEEFLS
jgi:hypothetical protein